MKAIWLLLTFVILAAGCATQPRPAPLAQGDIISMVKAGMADDEIVRRIDQTRTVFRLGSEDVIRLRQEGVSDRVVNYMLDTYAGTLPTNNDGKTITTTIGIIALASGTDLTGIIGEQGLPATVGKHHLCFAASSFRKRA